MICSLVFNTRKTLDMIIFVSQIGDEYLLVGLLAGRFFLLGDAEVRRRFCSLALADALLKDAR